MEFDYDFSDLIPNGTPPAAPPAVAPAVAATPPTPAPMPPVPPAATNHFGIGLDSVEKALAEDARIKRGNARVIEDARQQTVKELEVVRDSANRYREKAAITQEELSRIEAERAEALALANSNNPIDRIKLIGAQITKPRSYTREGRMARAQELSQILSLSGQIHNVEISQAESNVAVINARRDASLFTGETALDRLQTRVAAMNLLQQGMAATETMRRQQLDAQTPGTISQSLAAGPDELGFFQLGEFRYQEHELLTRNRDLQERQLLAALPIDPSNSTALAAHQALIVPRMSRFELEEVRKNGYEKDGMRLDPGLVEDWIKQKTATEVEELQRATQASLASPENVQRETQRSLDRYESMRARFDPLSPVGRALESYAQNLGTVAVLNEKYNTPEGRIQQMALLRAAEDGLWKAVDAEAGIQAKGDSKLQGILRNQMLGMPVDPMQLFDYGITNYTQGKGFSRAFEGQVAPRLLENADRAYAELIAGRDQWADSPNSTEMKELKAQAFNRAWEIELQTESLENIRQMGRAAMQRQDNPLVVSGIHAAEQTQILAQAGRLATEYVMRAEELNVQQYEAVINGRESDVQIDSARAQEIRASYNYHLVAAEYDLYEQQQPGLGKRYLDWLGREGNKLALNINNRHGVTASMYQQETQEAFATVIGLWSTADESATKRSQLVRTEAILQLGSPTVVIPALLDAVTQVPAPIKTRLYDEIIAPVISQANQQGMDQEQTMAAVITALESGHPTDPAVTKAAQQALKAMPNLLLMDNALRKSVERAVRQQPPSLFSPPSREMSYQPPEIHSAFPPPRRPGSLDPSGRPYGDVRNPTAPSASGFGRSAQ